MMLSNIERFFTPGIEIFKNENTNNGYGGNIQNWEFSEEIEGLIRPMSGEEKFSGDKNTSHGKYRLYCKNMEIDQTSRIKFKGNFYEIIFINNLMNFNKYLQIDLELIE